MPATTQKSTQVTKLDQGKKNVGANYGGGLRVFNFDFVQSGAGSTGSTVELIRIPPGRWYMYGTLSLIEWTVQATGITFDVGYAAYTGVDGTAVVAASTAFLSAVAADSGATLSGNIGTAIAAKSGKRLLLESRNGVSIYATFTSIADASEIHGYIIASN